MKILINGIGGRMGVEVKKLALEGYRDATLACGVDINPVSIPEAPVYTAYADVTEDVDCIIDFSHHTATPALLEYAVEKNIPVVLCTTGHDESEMALINKAAEKIALFHSANMSLGVALLCELAKTAAKTFPDADIEIIEKHHNRKLDAPSGTALMLFNAVKEEREQAFKVVGRNGHSLRQENEVGISSIRLCNVVGIHEVIISNGVETITLKHEAHDRALFASGAVKAALYLAGKGAGLYDMKKMLGEV